MERFSELRNKEVVNIFDGRCLGCIDDLCIDTKTGQITAIIVPQCGRIAMVFKRGDEILIPWFKIIKIGNDVILVECDSTSDHPDKPRR
jgi:YlmC/YmxH family sporulation protein